MKLKGKIIFDPDNVTKKHLNQSSWKRMALVVFQGDLCDLHAWFIEKRYNLKLNTPLRGAHISFINDSIDDIKKGTGLSEKEALKLWDDVKKKWDKKIIEVDIDTDVRTDGKYWWLIIPHDKRDELHGIRKELGLGRPFWGLHLSVGFANEKKLEHSKYIHKLVSEYGGTYN